MKLFKILESRLLDQPTKTPEHIAQEQNVPVAQVMKSLKAGIAVEQEHTSDIGAAREIALDHLAERWDYYDVLARAESNTVTEAPVPGTQFVTLDAAQIQEGLTYLEGLSEQISDESTEYDDENRPDIYRKLERDHRAVTAVQTVMQNNLRAMADPHLGANSIFLYDVDDSDLSYMDFVGAIHVVLEDRVAEVKWIGSYGANGGGLLKAAMKIAKQRGATSMKLDAKWESEGFYTKMGFQQTGPSVSQPLSGSQLTPFSKELDEVAMSPNALKTWVRQNSNVINNVTMGFEAEMCVPDLAGSEDDDELELDYREDEFISNYNWHQDIKNFFLGGESPDLRRDIQRAIDACEEDINDWISDDMQKSITKADVLERIRSNNPDLSTQEITDEYENQGAEHDTAMEELIQEYYENWEFDDWGSPNNCRKMSQFADRYDLSWPYWRESARTKNSDYSYSELADSWTSSSGYKSTASTGYHSTKRQPDLWIFEPDSSITPDDSDDGGVEMVSPPMPFQDGIAALTKFFAWAQTAGAYANQSCGFHIGVSLPLEMQKAIDPVKLLLFLGDEHVLAQFGRSANTYARSSMKTLRNKLSELPGLKNSNPQDGMAVVKRILADPARGWMEQLLNNSDRYVSVNIKDNYIEFRSAGGDYFEKQQEIFNTVMRYVRAMTIAADPQEEKQEYLKKLYKLLAGSIQQSANPIGAFMRYAAGQITRDELLKIIQQKAPSKPKLDSTPKPTGTAVPADWQHYEILRASDEFKVHEFLAPNPSAALEKKAQWASESGVKNSDYILRRPSTTPVAENFADGKGPGRPGDSQRHGIPKNATIAQLEKAAKSKGRKGQLARWQINMRRGHHKESLQELFDPDNLPRDIEIDLVNEYPDEKRWNIVREGKQRWRLDIGTSEEPGVWEVSFLALGSDRSWEITGGGGAPQIFAAVGAVLYQEAQKNSEIQGYLFTAKEPSRVKLYKVLSKKLSQQLHWVYDPQLGEVLRDWADEQVFAIVSPAKYRQVSGYFQDTDVAEATQPSAQTGASLTVWDIDDTLMHTAARVFVVEPSGRRRQLSPSEFNSYDLRPGEHYDFSEFQNSQLFYDTSKPIEKIWRTAQNTLANIGKRPGSRMIIVTARSEFDNTSLFLKTFEKHGMDMSKVKVYTVAGASNKKPLIRRLLDKGQFTECRLFDDHPGNLQDFLSLHQDFPEIKLKAFPVGHNGAVGNPVILGGQK